MNEIYQVAPWYNKEEWNKVYNNIYGKTSNLISKQNALDEIKIWKARSPSLPSGIESTMSLLYVHVQDLSQCNEIFNDHLLRLAYSSALIRFVNHMLDKEIAKGLSLYQAARTLGVPEWIIELRHDTAHSNKLPHLEMLREATDISFKWLQKNYWDTHKLCITDFVVGKAHNETEIENRIRALMNFCVSLSICSHPKCSIKKLADITDVNLRECLINDARELLEDSINLSNFKTVAIDTLRHALNKRAPKLLDNDASSSHVNKILLSDESAFISLQLYKHLDYCTYNNDKPLNRSYTQCFDGLLSFLLTHDLLRDFLLELIKVTQCANGNNLKKCKLAAKWVSIILNALSRNQQFMEEIVKADVDIILKDKNELRNLYYHWYPNNKKRTLLLDLHKPVPKEFTNINFIQPIISTYNPYLVFFIKDLLNLVRPQLPEPVIAKICQLTKVIASPEKFPDISLRIYTADDLETVNNLEENCGSKPNDNIENVKVHTELKENNNVEKENQQKFGIWQVASKNHDWSTCPIGQLPWEQLLPEEPMETQ